MKDLAILTGISSFVLGIFVSSFIFVSPVVSLFLIFVALAVILAEWAYYRVVNVEVLILSIFILCVGLGSLRYAIKDFHELKIPTLEGVVVSEPEEKDSSTRFVFKSENNEKVLVSTGLYDEIQYGDRVRLEGEFKSPEIIKEEGRLAFDYPQYLSKDDIYFTMSFAKVEVLEHGQGNSLKALLYKIKGSFMAQIKETFAEPYASLLAGLIVAGRDAMPKDILEEFRRAGIIHIVVLSGYNITIIAEFLRRMFERIFLLTRTLATPIAASAASIAGILLFVLMTGAQATVVRAAIMVLVVILAKMLGRKYSASRALLVAGVLMLLENPKILVFDPSFQLSFLATLALIYVVPMVEEYLNRVPSKWELRTTLATTIGTQITVLPLLVYSVGDISLVSLPANVLVLLIIPYTMLLGFVSITISYISSVLALPLAYVTHLLLAWILNVSHVLGNLSFATIKTPHVSVWVVAFVYLALLGVVMYLGRQKDEGSLG